MYATIIDVAKAAGVSTATVGRVLHGKGYVSQEARERIENAIAQLGYVPNQSARSLKGGRSGMIGSLVLQNPNGLYYRINECIREAAEAGGYELVTMEAFPQGGEERLIRSFIGLRIDGLVITSDGRVSCESLSALGQARIPVVAVERGYLDYGVDSLLVKDLEAVRDAVGRMIEKGHRRIAFLGVRGAGKSKKADGAMGPGVELQRYSGYVCALEKAGLPLKEELVRLLPDYRTETGREAAAELLCLKEPPTAVFCGADTLAAGVLQAAYARGLRVPQDLSLVGYDDVLSRSLAPAVDSVALKLDGVGTQLMELLERRRANPKADVQCRWIETEYQDRGTVRKIM